MLIHTHKYIQAFTHMNTYVRTYIHTYLRRGADKSFAQPTSRCRRTESIVSLERWVFMCRIPSLFLLLRLKGSMSGDAHYFNNLETRAIINVLFPLQSKVAKEIHSILTETLGEHAPSYTTVKNLVIFPTVMRLVLDDPKQ